MTKRFEGKVALITGGTTGIGLAAAKLFHEEGARVIATGSNPKTLEAARAELRDIAEVVPSDAGDSAQIRELFERVKREHGGLDVLFLNAGVMASGPIASLDEKKFDDVFRINVKGPWFALQAAIPLLGRGSAVVFNTSIAGETGIPGAGAYSATKAALRSIVRTAAAELAPHGIRVNAVSPGPTDTGIIAKNAPSHDAVVEIEKSLADRIPQKRLGRPDEIARAVLFVASDDASFMTGEEIVVDGGMTRV